MGSEYPQPPPRWVTVGWLQLLLKVPAPVGQPLHTQPPSAIPGTVPSPLDLILGCCHLLVLSPVHTLINRHLRVKQQLSAGTPSLQHTNSTQPLHLLQTPHCSHCPLGCPCSPRTACLPSGPSIPASFHSPTVQGLEPSSGLFYWTWPGPWQLPPPTPPCFPPLSSEPTSTSPSQSRSLSHSGDDTRGGTADSTCPSRTPGGA